MGTPLKLEGTNGDLKEMTTAEENYLAYQAGEQLKASAKTEVGAITDASSGNETVGAFTDTRFDQVPGSHGSITTTSTVTTLYQTEGTPQKTVEILEMQCIKVQVLIQILTVDNYMNLLLQKWIL